MLSTVVRWCSLPLAAIVTQLVTRPPTCGQTDHLLVRSVSSVGHRRWPGYQPLPQSVLVHRCLTLLCSGVVVKLGENRQGQTALSNCFRGIGLKPRQPGPVGHCGDQYLLDSLLGLREGQVDETLTLGQVPIVHNAQQDPGHLNPARYRNHLGVEGKRDVSCQLFSEGGSSVASSKTTDGPSEQLSDALVNLCLCLQDQAGYSGQRLTISSSPSGPRQANPSAPGIFHYLVSDRLLPAAGDRVGAEFSCLLDSLDSLALPLTSGWGRWVWRLPPGGCRRWFAWRGLPISRGWQHGHTRRSGISPCGSRRTSSGSSRLSAGQHAGAPVCGFPTAHSLAFYWVSAWCAIWFDETTLRHDRSVRQVHDPHKPLCKFIR